jgi:hippurate hydrolase
MNTVEIMQGDLAVFTAWRQHLHRHPELLFDLPETAGFVADKLRSFGCDEVVTGLGRSGVVAVIRGAHAGSSRSIGIRADMDALPITEATNLDYRSQVPGRMHACGHDGHTTILLAAAQRLCQTRNFSGTVVVIFQPAEEGGAGGALAMMADGLFERFPVDEIYGLHNWPGVPVGSFAIRPGALLASFDGFEITVDGVGGHAATPEKGVDTVVVLASIVTALQTIVSRNVDPRHAVVISTCTIHAGEANNIIPSTGRLTGSVRTLSAADSELCERRMRSLCDAIAGGFGAQASLSYTRTLPPTVNDETCARHLTQAARDIAGDDRVDGNIMPQMGAEDFAFLAQARPGAFILLGNGESASLHSPAYDFCDEAISHGAALWIRLAETRLAAAR